MARSYYFALTALPDVPELGGVPPVELAALRQVVGEEGSGALGALVDAILLEQDLLAREAALAGEAQPAEALVLSPEQVRGEQSLPEFLLPPEGRSFRVPADATWEAYWRHVRRVADAAGSGFLRAWAGFEVALRNALAAARATALDLDAAEYLVARDLADGDAPTAEVVSAWAAAPDPLAALRVLEQARWHWATEHSRYFSFAVDELVAYARRLVLVTRWHNLEAGGR